jgi:hypothetical protein
VTPSPPPPPRAAPAEAVTAPVARPQESESSVWSSPILWVAIGAAVIGGGVALAFALNKDASLYGGSTGVVLQK